MIRFPLIKRGVSSITAAAVMLALVMPVMTQASTPQEIQAQIDAKNQQIQQLQQEIQAYQNQADAAGAQSKTLQSEITKLNAQIGQITAEIKSLQASIDQTGLEIDQTNNQITDAEQKIALHQQALAQTIVETDAIDHQSLAVVLLQHTVLSDFFDYLHSVQRTQDTLATTIASINDLKDQLDRHQQELDQQKQDLEQMKSLQEVSQRQLASTKGQKNQILVQTKGQESKFQSLVKKTQTDLKALQEEIYYLQQNGISVDDAIKYANLAAIGVGIRPAFLLAELEQESALGKNVGKCYIVDSTSGATRQITNGQIYAKGIHPTRDLPLFLSITAQLGKDPFQTPISCGSSWGGAMGPAQFIPSTWMGYRDEVVKVTGHSVPNPWNAEDAFTAAAAKFFKDGASTQTKAGEVAASKRYYCGSATSTSSKCIIYANSVQRLAAQIEQNL